MAVVILRRLHVAIWGMKPKGEAIILDLPGNKLLASFLLPQAILLSNNNWQISRGRAITRKSLQ
jgi:uncharacterized protein YceK